MNLFISFLFIFIEVLYEILHKLKFVKFYICKLCSFQIDVCHAHDKKVESLTERSCAKINAWWND